MGTHVESKQDTKKALLEVGMNVMLAKGYTNTGIQEVLNELNVPKGSFYYHFDSKENYAVEIIRHYDLEYAANLKSVLGNPQQTPLERLRAYCETGKAMFVAQDCCKGCLIGNLSQEMADQSEVLRKELSTVMGKWRDLIAACIEEGQKLNEIKRNRTPHELAELFSAGLAGAVMRSKTVKNTESLDIFMDLMFNDVLKA